jgi:hypothetical protein
LRERATTDERNFNAGGNFSFVLKLSATYGACGALVFLIQGVPRMNYRIIGLALATIASVAPALSHASTEKDALNSCVRTFAASLAAPGAAAPAYKVEYRGNQYVQSMVAEVYSHGYTFHLLARNAKTRLPLAQANCETDSHGAVVAMSPLPAESPLPSLAAQ